MATYTAELYKLYSDIEFSVQFEQNLLSELDFLKSVDDNQQLSDNNVLQNALRRYEQCWLPLVAAEASIGHLAPPLDVHWIWHCHMLSPYNYVADCTKIVGKVVDHVVKSRDQLVTGRQATEVIWKEKYPQEPFHFDELTPSDIDYNRLSGYDIVAATRRQAKFYYNVSLPHYKDSKFREIAVDRYKKFLYLKKLNQDALLIPCYDIDLVWHTHQLHPVIYSTDTIHVLGRMLNHDDTLDDRSPGSVQNRATIKTKELWKTLYNEFYAMCGAMYRGESPRGRLFPVLATIDRSVVLTVTAGQFENCVMPEHIEQLWGPIPLPRLPPGTDNKCIAATHSLYVNDKLELTCRVVHSIPLAMSAVQVFQHHHMVAVSHLVGSDQLPNSSHLTGFIGHYLNFNIRERAMIIKDNVGDWGIVVGRWDGFKKGIPSKKPAPGERRGVTGVKGSPGHFAARFIQLRPPAQVYNQNVTDATSSSSLGGFKFTFLDMLVDMKSGRIEFKPLDGDVPQKTCLAMSVATLFVLCQPRPPKPSTKPPPKRVDANGLAIGRIESETLMLVVAAGFLAATPCNSYYTSTVYCGSCSGGCAGCGGSWGDSGTAGGCGAGCGGCGSGCGGDGGGDGGGCDGDGGGGGGGGCGGGCGGCGGCGGGD